MRLGDRIAEVATSFLGKPAWYFYDWAEEHGCAWARGKAWCDTGASRAVSDASGGRVSLCAGMKTSPATGVFPAGCTYVPTSVAWARTAGLFVRSMPQIGDLALVACYAPKPGVPDHATHIGSGVTWISSDGKRFKNIECNYSGNVQEKTRPVVSAPDSSERTVGFIRPRDPAEDAPTSVDIAAVAVGVAAAWGDAESDLAAVVNADSSVRRCRIVGWDETGAGPLLQPVRDDGAVLMEEGVLAPGGDYIVIGPWEVAA